MSESWTWGRRAFLPRARRRTRYLALGAMASPPALHVGVLVPLRRQAQFPRAEHLRRLLRHLAAGPAALPPRLPVSGGARVAYTVVVAEERLPEGEDEDTYAWPRKFNRGLLLNAAFRLCPRPVDMIVLHDVDLLPSPDLGPHYAVPLPRGAALHLGARWGRYTSAQYLGGVLAMHPADFIAIDGFPLGFWGWGGEDDALRLRILRRGVAVRRPARGAYADLEGLDLAGKLALLRATGAKCMDKREVLSCEKKAARRLPQPGLRATRFVIASTQKRRVAPHLGLHHHQINIGV